MLISFVVFPLSILATLLMFTYYICIRFGKSIVTYAVIMGFSISLIIIAVRLIPPLLTLGITLYLLNRLLIITSVSKIKDLDAKLVADHLVSFEIASLIALLVAAEFGSIFTDLKVSYLLLLIIIVWYIYNIIYNLKALSVTFGKWSRSE